MVNKSLQQHTRERDAACPPHKHATRSGPLGTLQYVRSYSYSVQRRGRLNPTAVCDRTRRARACRVRYISTRHGTGTGTGTGGTGVPGRYRDHRWHRCRYRYRILCLSFAAFIRSFIHKGQDNRTNIPKRDMDGSIRAQTAPSNRYTNQSQRAPPLAASHLRKILWLELTHPSAPVRPSTPLLAKSLAQTQLFMSGEVSATGLETSSETIEVRGTSKR